MSGKRARKNPEKEKTSAGSLYSLRENILTAMQIPGDLACKDSIITLTGPSRAVIENYKSILFYSSEQLIILTCKGKVTLQGKNLEIAAYSPMEMEIKGFISCVLMERG